MVEETWEYLLVEKDEVLYKALNKLLIKDVLSSHKLCPI